MSIKLELKKFIKDQFWIFIASVIENPSFSSQTKEELITPAKASEYLKKNHINLLFL